MKPSLGAVMRDPERKSGLERARGRVAERRRSIATLRSGSRLRSGSIQGGFTRTLTRRSSASRVVHACAESSRLFRLDEEALDLIISILCIVKKTIEKERCTREEVGGSDTHPLDRLSTTARLGSILGSLGFRIPETPVLCRTCAQVPPAQARV